VDVSLYSKQIFTSRRNNSDITTFVDVSRTTPLHPTSIKKYQNRRFYQKTPFKLKVYKTKGMFTLFILSLLLFTSLMSIPIISPFSPPDKDDTPA
jgi:hypothetical protein